MSKLPYFDPRQIPVEGVDAHLPAVAQHALQPAALRQRFISPPVWTPELVAEKTFSERQPIHASVLLPIVMREQPTVLLTERTMHLSTHSGQIAFPGGKADEEDADASATALREAQANAAETARRLKAQQENQRAQDAALARARADADRAAADADRVRAQATEAAREWSTRLGDSPTVGDSQAAAAAIGVCADVLGRAIAHARLLASTADAARAAGLKCSADYEALIPDKP